MSSINNIAQLEFPASMGTARTFDLIFKLYHQPLRFFASKYVPSDESEDIVENMFLRLWKKNQQFENRSHLQAFLYRSVNNACLDYLKISKRALKRQLDAPDPSIQEVESYLNTMIQAEVMAEIYRAINLLPSQCAKVISMSYIEGLTNSEIAERMNTAYFNETGQSISGQTVREFDCRTVV